MRRTLLLALAAVTLTACSPGASTDHSSRADPPSAATSAAATSNDSAASVARAREVIELIDRHGLYAKGSAWAQAKERALADLQDPHESVYLALQRVVAAGGGSHSFLLPAAAADPSAPDQHPTPQVTGEGGITTITITGDPPTPAAQDADAQTIATGLAARDAATCGWVVDLRNHPGGSVVPLFRGLAPLLPEGVVLGFRDREGQAAGEFRIRDRVLRTEVFHPDPQLSTEPQTSWPVAPTLRARPLAVLQSGGTASAAEAAVIAFRGIQGVRSFGAPTAGRTSGNVAIEGPDGIVVVLTTGTMTDRAGHDYAERPVVPDQAASGDQARAAAVAWLAGQGCS